MYKKQEKKTISYHQKESFKVVIFRSRLSMAIPQGKIFFFFFFFVLVHSLVQQFLVLR